MTDLMKLRDNFSEWVGSASLPEICTVVNLAVQEIARRGPKAIEYGRVALLRDLLALLTTPDA